MYQMVRLMEYGAENRPPTVEQCSQEKYVSLTLLGCLFIKEKTVVFLCLAIRIIRDLYMERGGWKVYKQMMY